METTILKQRLKRIEAVFGTELLQTLVNPQVSSQDIRSYYKTNKLAYSFLHSRTNCIHMAISRDLKYKEEDLFDGARLVEKYIRTTNAKNVLELACGRGANTLYLANIFPNVDFAGTDISHEQLSFAHKNSKANSNAKFSFGNYHNLSNINDDSQDIIFIIEALCYSNNKNEVLEEVKTKLKKGGIFIILDGYLNKPIKNLSKDEILAKKYVERGMAVNNFEYYPGLIKSAIKLGFEVLYEEDVSKFIIPNLLRFEKMSKIFFNHIIFVRVLNKVLPFDFTKNAITAYLLPELVKRKVANYTITVLKKP